MKTSGINSFRDMAATLIPLTVAAGDCKGIRYIDAEKDVDKDKLFKHDRKTQLTITLS